MPTAPPGNGSPERDTPRSMEEDGGAAGGAQGKSGFSRCLCAAALTERGRCKCTYWHLLITWPLGGSRLHTVMDGFAGGSKRRVWKPTVLRPPLQEPEC